MRTRFVLLTLAAVACLTVSTLAIFTNGGFEDGNFNGWTKSAFINPGLSGAQPYSGASIVRNAGGADRTSVVGPAAQPMDLSDPLVAAVQFPRFGQHAAVVNYFGASGTPGAVANSLLQQSVVTPADVDPDDGLVHVRFAYLPVLEDGGHTPSQQAYFYVAIRNVTKSTVIWQRFAFANEPGVPWLLSGDYRYTPWQLVDASGGPGVIDVGDTLEIEVIAAGCSPTGHRAHVYVDAFGSTIPGGTIVATAPESTVAGAALTYAFRVENGGTSTLTNPVLSIAVPAQTTFASVTDPACSHSAGVVTCNLADLAAGASLEFDMTVTVSGGATGTITLGNYSISGTGYPALLGPTRTTVLGAPVAVADSYSTPEDTPLSVALPGVLANDTDPTGEVLTAVLVAQPSHGSVVLNANGSFVYTPTANYHGPDSFIYRARDPGNVSSANTNVALTVTAVNDAPTAVADAYNVNEDAVLTVNAAGVLANDTDVDPGAVLSAALVAGPSHGSLQFNADGSFTYTPNANYAGPDGFTYRANDGTANSNVAAVTITVNNVNDAPVGTDDAYSTNEDTALNVAAPGVLANDTDPDAGAVLSVALVTGPSHGSLQLNANGSFTYTPTGNYNGPDGFVYTVSDGTLQSGSTAVTLTVNAVNDQPVGTADGPYVVAEDATLTVAAPAGVLANDSDPENDPLSAAVVAGPAHGALTLNPDGSFTYTPSPNYHGPDSFTYRASDGALQSAVTTVTLTVTPEVDPPTAVDDGGSATFQANEDGTLTVAAGIILANDVDPDGDPLTAALVTPPAHGTLAFNPDGSFTYTPNADYNGADSFTYTVTDGMHTSPPATVTLQVLPANDPPTAEPNAYTLTEDRTLTVPASSGLLANDSDIDTFDTLTAVLVSGPSHGTLTLNADGSFTYVPDANFHGTDSFSYQVNDGTTTSAPVTVTLTIADDADLAPGAGLDTGGTRVKISGSGFGPAGTPVTVLVGGVPAPDAEVLDDGTITFVTPGLPANTPQDVVFTVEGGTPETLALAWLPLPLPAAGDPTDTDGDGIPDEVELKYGLDPTDPDDASADPDGDGVPSATEITNGEHPTARWVRYFAEGLNNEAFNTKIAIANASAATMQVHLTFFRQGAPAIAHRLALAGRSRTLLDTAAIAGLAGAAFGVEIEANEAVAADRTTVWQIGGHGAHSEHAVEASPTWYFAEGATTGRFTLFYLLTNPQAQPATATVTYLRQTGTPIVRQYTIPAYARYTIAVESVDPALANADLGGMIVADRPIVAERSMYLSTASQVWEAGSGGVGVTAPATRWFFGEGATGSFFDAWILLSNPGTTDAAVMVRYVADSGADVTRTHTVPAGRRITIRVVDEDPAMAETSFATFVTATNDVPVVAERAMWWRSSEGAWTSGHVGVGFNAGARKWVTADGVAAADGSDDTYALVTNTDARAGLLKVTALFGDGTAPVERLYPIGPNQRFTLRGRQRFPEVVGKGYSFVIESIGPTPVDIVVDHSTYWNVGERFWAAGSTAPASVIPATPRP